MLVLNRKHNEKIIIGEGDKQVIITLIQVTNKQVKLGFTASNSIPIHREEVYQKISSNQE